MKVWLRQTGLVGKLVLCLACLLTSMSVPSEASLPIPKAFVPNIWQQAGRSDITGWIADGNYWSYVVIGDLKTLKEEALVHDLSTGGWRRIRVTTSVPTGFLDEWLGIVIDMEEVDLPTASLHVHASQGPWELMLLAGEAEMVRQDDDYVHEYIAILSHNPGLEVVSHGVLAKEYQVVPGSKLVRAFVPTNVSDIEGYYIFEITGPIDAVLAYYANQPDWEVQSLGYLGGFGYNEKTTSFLTVFGSSLDLSHDDDELSGGELGTVYMIVQGLQQMDDPWRW